MSLTLARHLRESRERARLLNKADVVRRLKDGLRALWDSKDVAGEKLPPDKIEKLEASYLNKIEKEEGDGRIQRPGVPILRVLCGIYGIDFHECLRIGRYPAYEGAILTEVPDVHPELLAKLRVLPPEMQDLMVSQWSAFEGVLQSMAAIRTIPRPAGMEQPDGSEQRVKFGKTPRPLPEAVGSGVDR